MEQPNQPNQWEKVIQNFLVIQAINRFLLAVIQFIYSIPRESWDMYFEKVRQYGQEKDFAPYKNLIDYMFSNIDRPINLEDTAKDFPDREK